ncbi:unnamed protein product [Phytomonas sp. Hart1]|nr:unnamed protein product [Phytomonas sp. Hart1]|eukprot:CCW66147.1 unnamed protein product [Phytomonas sp. isolate Hart1]
MNPNAAPYKITFAMEKISKDTSITSSSPPQLFRGSMITAADYLRQLRMMEERHNKPEDYRPQPDSINLPQSSICISSSVSDFPQRDLRSKVIRYSKAELLQIQETVLHAVAHGPVVDVPPFKGVPVSLAGLLRLPYALEYIDIEASVALAKNTGLCAHPTSWGMPGVETAISSGFAIFSFDDSPMGVAVDRARAGNTKNLNELNRGPGTHLCPICAHACGPCAVLDPVFRQITQRLLRTRLGACLLQSDNVVWAQLQLALVFESKKSSLRMRLLAEKHPAVVRRVGEYLYGEGYHLRLPVVTAHNEWRELTKMLKFDAIRDNLTRIKTDLSKRWRQYHTPFEQFVFFFSFRDDRPKGVVKNVVTQSVKPGMVAILTGDLMAMYLLHKLGFFIPPDYYWEVFLFMKRSVGKHGTPQDLVRHFALHLSSKQCPNIFNPVENIRIGTKGFVS